MNILMLTIGRTGSTILTRMLGKLGWNLPSDVDEYAEPVAIREINDRLILGLPVCAEDLHAATSTLESPWVAKDPRFVRTLGEWKPHFEGAMLLWLTRDLQDVECSLRRAGWGKSTSRGVTVRGETLSEIDVRCGHIFEEWDGPKMKLAYEDLKGAISLFDVGRG